MKIDPHKFTVSVALINANDGGGMLFNRGIDPPKSREGSVSLTEQQFTTLLLLKLAMVMKLHFNENDGAGLAYGITTNGEFCETRMTMNDVK